MLLISKILILYWYVLNLKDINIILLHVKLLNFTKGLYIIYFISYYFYNIGKHRI